MRYLIITLLLSYSALAYSQNRADYFKAIPNINDDTPDWAALMYADNPNVFEVENLYRQYYKVNKFEKTLHTQNLKHWLRAIRPLVNNDGYIIEPDKKLEDIKYKKLKERYEKRNISRSSATNEWVSIGPFETYEAGTTLPISWHKNIYSIDQSKSNPNILICGTEAGGVYKSTDKAANWTLISKAEAFSGSNAAVKIHPADPNILLVSANRRIYQSIDGGASWNERHYINGTGNEFVYAPANSNTIFHTSNTGLYRSDDGGVNWSSVLNAACWDIDFHPTDTSVVYLLKSNSSALRSELMRSDDGGSTWFLKDNGWYNPSSMQNADDEGGKIAVTSAAPDIVYVCLIGESKSGDDGWIGVYKSSDRGESWTNPAGQDGGPYGAANTASPWNVAAYSDGYHQGYYNFDMEASQTDSNKLWVGTIRLSESSDGGASFESIGAADGNRLSYIHADIQDIEVNGSEIWVASDGGVNYSNDELNTHVALNKGIQAAHFWGFNTGWNDDTYTGGKYHDGTTGWSSTYSNGKAYNIGGVEEASGYVHPIESRKLMFRTHYDSDNTSVVTIPETFGDQVKDHADLPVRPNEGYWTAERSGVYFDPRYANHIYVGLENKVYKSIDGGNSFDVIYTFPNAGGMIYEMEISRSNPDYIYCVYNKLGGAWDACEIWRSTDGGHSWARTASNPTGNRLRFRISLHPEDENKLWICTARGDNGNKVFYTYDGGQSWSNKTTSVLDNENLTDILYQGGSNDVVYLTSDNGVFCWDVATSNWLDYSLGLPMVAKSLQINPFYKESELRFASEGRGVWKRKMKDSLSYPIAQPITYGDTVLCKEDTVLFDCYSMLNHNGASWSWTISPAPAYISSQSSRAIKVVFDAAGSYDVTLAVTNAQGLTDSKTITDMVTVNDHCVVDTVPGLALSCNSSSSYVNIPDVKLNGVDNFTISAWINPSGVQENWSSIVMNDGDGAGLNFYHDDWNPNLQLGYHWPGGAWWWTSGLIVDSNKWSHVAMVVTPSNVTLYLNGEASVHNTATNPVDLSSMKIGSYQGWGSRNFRGLIDEVCLWDRALSQDEIRELRHLTRTGPQSFTNNLFLYYQFNLSNSSNILDRVGTKHTTLAGTTEKLLSTAPVAGGVSDRVFISSGGSHYFPNSATTLEFGNIVLNGEVVVSRLHSPPNSLPSTNPHVPEYWIINNYGSSSFGALDSVNLKAYNSHPVGNPSDAKLFSRGANEHLSSWNELCSADNYSGQSFNFSSSCNVNDSYQLFIQSANSNQISTLISSPIGIELNEFGEELLIYPNPTSGGINIELGKLYTELDVNVYNMGGQLVINKRFTSTDKLYLELDLIAGYYMLDIAVSGDVKATIKILKQ